MIYIYKRKKQAVNRVLSLSLSFKNDSLSLFFKNNSILLRKSFHKRKRLSLKGVIKQCEMDEYRYVILESDSYSSFNRPGIFSFSLFYLHFCEFYLFPSLSFLLCLSKENIFIRFIRILI